MAELLVDIGLIIVGLCVQVYFESMLSHASGNSVFVVLN